MLRAWKIGDNTIFQHGKEKVLASQLGQTEARDRVPTDRVGGRAWSACRREQGHWGVVEGRDIQGIAVPFLRGNTQSPKVTTPACSGPLNLTPLSQRERQMKLFL